MEYNINLNNIILFEAEPIGWKNESIFSFLIYNGPIGGLG